jgi:hypothetical protein
LLAELAAPQRTITVPLGSPLGQLSEAAQRAHRLLLLPSGVALTPLPVPLLLLLFLVSASREEESEQEDQSESPSSASPVVIVIQPNVQIHMPEGFMQRPERSESESEYEQRPEQSMQQPDRESEKGEEEQMDRPPSSLAAPISLRQSAIKVALMRRKVMMLESKLSMLRSKLAGDSSFALPIARARRQLMRAKLALAIAERRHRLLRHRKLKEHESKLLKPDELKLKHGQTDETTHFDTQGQRQGGGSCQRSGLTQPAVSAQSI